MVLFVDLSDVFIHGMYDMDEILRYRFGEHVAEMANARHEVMYPDRVNELCRGNITEEQYWTEFLSTQRWPEGITPRVLQFALTANMRKSIVGTVDVFKRICGYPSLPGGRDIRMGLPQMVLVSDQIKEHVPEIEKYHKDVFELFDKNSRIWSFDLGLVKKDPEFFPTVLEKLEIGPEEVIFIDDSGKNIEAAWNAGIENSIRFESATQLEKALERCGFVFKPIATAHIQLAATGT